ncbi:MAG: alpha/beta fold hydrolase [Kineosporiaceae bacterium]
MSDADVGQGDGYVRVDGARLYRRVIGAGPPVVIVHGGPDFDHMYLRPELDRLARRFRLVYYDQRGRGRSAGGVSPSEVTIESEVEDLDRVRAWLGLDAVAVLGHSWGGLLAMEYALRHPGRVSHLILLNSAPASHADWMLLREELRRRRPARDVEAMAAAATDPAYARGDPAAEVDYYRYHFRIAVAPEHLERVVGRLRSTFTAASVLTARAIEERLNEQTWLRPDYDLLPGLCRLDVPTIVVHGDRDLIPLETARHVADAFPGATLHVLEGCGHFAYLERPVAVEGLVAALLESP